jgi:hypothetical protein
MTTFLMGHGGLSADRPKTIVPEGGSITFYTDVDFNLLLTNGMASVQTGEAGSGYRVEGGEPVENYYLEGYTDNQRVRFETVAMSGLNVVYIGDQIPNKIHLCEGDDTMCGGGRHICGGVFGRLDDLDIIYLACRGVMDAPPKTQREYGASGDTTIQDELDKLVADIRKLSEEEQGQKLCQMEDAHDPDAQEGLAYLMNWPDLRKAAYKERTRQSLKDMEPDDFAKMFKGQPATEQGWMKEVPGVNAIVDKPKPSLFGNKPK